MWHGFNLPFLNSNIPSSPAYGVFIAQLIWYARAYSSYECFILRAVRLLCNLIGQRYARDRPSGRSMVDMGISSNIMKSSSPKFYITFWDMIIYSDTLHWLDISLNRGFVTELGLLTVFDVITLFPEVPWDICNEAASQQRTLTPPGTWSCPIWDLHFFLMLRPFFPELVMSTDLLSFEHPLVLLFCSLV